MPYFKNFKTPHNSKFKDVVVNTSSFTWLFDYNTGIYGVNFRIPSFEDPPKPLKFIVKNYVAIDSIFVSHSDSIGPLFLKNTKIYLTKPVYEQILSKYEEYKSLILSYDEENFDNLINNDDAFETQLYKRIKLNKESALPLKILSI